MNIYFLKFKKKFDIIFLDPPYKDKNLNNILNKNIKKKKFLKKNGIIIFIDIKKKR